MVSVQVKSSAVSESAAGAGLTRPTPDHRVDTRDAPDAMPMLRVALAGGGTGGHIVPGLHLLAAPRARAMIADVLWFQTGRAVEARVLAGAEARLSPAKLERVTLALEPEGGGAPSLGRLLVQTLPAVLRARRALREHRSQVLVGLGGFTSLPAVLAARSMGLPTALLEINAHAGRATRWLSASSTRVMHAWKATLPELANSRDVLIGPPLAPEFTRGAPSLEDVASARKQLGFDPLQPLLTVLGGSQGAGAINRFVAEHAPTWTQQGLSVLHQVGPGRRGEAPVDCPGYRAVEYVHDVAEALRASSLVLCRGGASSLAEIGAMRRPAWIVPYPHHADGHQLLNARELRGGARIVHESQLGVDCARQLLTLCSPSGESERRAMAAALAGVVPLDGAARMFEEVERLAIQSSSRFQSDSARH